MLLRIVFYFLALIQGIGLGAVSTDDVVIWDTQVERTSEGNYRLFFEANIKEGWYIFSQNSPEGGSQPAFFEFENSKNFERIGEVVESEAIPSYNEVFAVTELIFKQKASFYQDIKLLDPGAVVNITLYYQVCQTVCIAATETFRFELGDVTYSQADRNEVNRSVDELKVPLKNIDRLSATLVQTKNNRFSAWWIGFIGGLIALLTPCVFPLIPLTTSYFSTAKSRNHSFFYGLSIVLIYTLIGLPFLLGWSKDAQIFNELASNLWVNLALFIVLIGFAFSFISGKEIQLPQSWMQKVDEQTNRSKGLLAILFMALTLVLVSFSCTGPILGAALGTLLSGNGSDLGVNLTLVFNGFGFGLGVPFTLAAYFPSVLKKLPKSGGWMKELKVGLGVVEAFLAFKFLSNADLIGKWGIFKLEYMLGLWMLLWLGLLAYYLIRSIQDKAIGVVRGVFSMISIYLLVLIISGFSSVSNLGFLSAFAPPSYYNLHSEVDEGCPLGLHCFHDLESGITEAKSKGKPILLDFTGYSCVNCRKMESDVWSDPEIYELLDQKFVIISLYVDDREKLNDDKSGTYLLSNGGTKEVKTIGQYYSLFQGVNFKVISQPYYVPVSSNYDLLNTPVQMTSVANFKGFLETSLEVFEALEITE
ncbi:MAG: Thiol:disulfide interchange protein DsbD [Flavobacteriaceae bacterium]|nr:MAG: Thiol:disulfide interchange protein DsbD [Flavobacteriaceae bacterium]